MTTKALDDVIAERQRQVEVEGWTPEHDDGHDERQLAHAAGCYALFSGSHPDAGCPPPTWPWDDNWWKPSEYRRDLVKAAALLLAEIERVDRAALKGTRPDKQKDWPYVSAQVLDCEACMTPDACRIRGQCAHYLREKDAAMKGTT